MRLRQYKKLKRRMLQHSAFPEIARCFLRETKSIVDRNFIPVHPGEFL